MSCRASKGSSAVTSLAAFLTNAPEQTVQECFHSLKKETRAKAVGTATDSETVLTFIREQQALARHDSRVPEARRAHLLYRLEVAEQQVQDGTLPDEITFAAWRGLRQRVEQSLIEQDSRTARYLQDDASSLKTRVETLVQEYEKARQKFDSTYGQVENSLARSGLEDQQEKNEAEHSINLLYSRVQKAISAYDATDEGFNALNAGEATFANASPLTISERLIDAYTSRQSLEDESQNDANFTPDISAARAKRDKALSELQRVQGEAQINASNKSKLEKVSREYAKYQRAYLESIFKTHKNLVHAKQDLRSVQTWASVTGTTNVSRADLWRAIEQDAVDQDRVELHNGLITDLQVARRAVARAEARQAVLDSEGEGAYDPVNRRYAISLERRRARH